MQRLTNLARIAEEGGVTLAHENCAGWGGLGPEEACEMIEEVGSPNLKLIWDTGNPVEYDQDPWEFYNGVKEHVAYVHIKDARRDEDGSITYTYPGEGDGRVKDIIKDLKDRGYDGPVSIEPHVEAVIHEGTEAGEDEQAYNSYVKYGRELMRLVDSVE